MVLFQGVFLELEDVIDGAAEDARQQKSQGEAGDIAVALNGINALAGDTDRGRQLLLGEVASGAEFADAVVDDGFHVKLAFHLKDSPEGPLCQAGFTWRWNENLSERRLKICVYSACWWVLTAMRTVLF